MIRFENSETAFDHAIARAKEMGVLYGALTALRSTPSNADALRAAWIQAVSSFDYFVHEIFWIEAVHRFANALPTRNISVPMEVYSISDPAIRLAQLEATIRNQNSHKAFVAPDKVAEALSCFCENPWEKIGEEYNKGRAKEEKLKSIKTQLRNIWQRRNKIAHEADINPDLAGVSLWPMYPEDTEYAIQFISDLGSCLTKVISAPL